MNSEQVFTSRLDTIARPAQVEAEPQPYQPASVDQVLDRVGELAALPQVVFKVVDLTGSDHTSALAMERAIIVDPGFSARLLSCANSAYYGLPRKVTSIREAVTFLGLRAVRQLAMTVGVFELFVGKNDAESLRRRAWWRHSLDTAICCKWLAAKTMSCKQDEAYTCGLLHLTGKTLLDRYEPSRYDVVQEQMRLGFSELDAERQAYGCDHIQVIVGASQKWGFPEVLSEGVSYVQPSEGQPSALCSCTAIATRIASRHIGKTPQGEPEPACALPGWALERLAIDPAESEALVADGREAIMASTSLTLG